MRPESLPSLTAEQWDWVVSARPSAARSALRLGAGNTLGLRPDDLRALAEEGLWVAAPRFDPARGVDFPVFAYKYVRGAVLHEMRARRARSAHETPMAETRQARDRACLDELGAGVDPEAYDAYEDTDEDFLRRAEELAGEAMLTLALDRELDERRLAQIEAELPNLVPLHARLIRMRFLEHQKLDAIVSATGIPRTTVFRALAEAVAALRSRLGEA
jgi:RNA polymerase sigma factor FliA